MVDKFGTELEVGDFVIYGESGSVELHSGRIIKVTKKTVYIMFSAWLYPGHTETTICKSIKSKPGSVVKATEQYQIDAIIAERPKIVGKFYDDLFDTDEKIT